MSLHHGDCLDVMAAMEPGSVDAVVTDPPYLLRFMGKSWDSPTQMSGHATPDAGTVGFYQAVGKGGRHDGGHDNWRPNQMGEWHRHWAEAAYRVAKPSAYLLAFGGTRTVHRMTVALEDAGWIIRDMLVWAYASGFPKSKASLKPAWEPIVMARKPGPLRELAIDACRIGYVSTADSDEASVSTTRTEAGRNKVFGRDLVKPGPVEFDAAATGGRWPANVILTDPIFDGGWDGVVGGGDTGPAGTAVRRNGGGGDFFGGINPKFRPDVPWEDMTYGDSGTYSRFFILPKADRTDREPVLGGLPEREARTLGDKAQGPLAQQTPYRPAVRANHHPTVKPVDLMRHLVRLVTPTGGIVLDPFAGSGSTLLASEMEGFDWIGIEKEAEYVAIAEARLNGTQRGLGLPA